MKFFNQVSFPFCRQFDQMDCGPTCLQMVAKYYGRQLSLEKLRERCFLSREGVSLLGVSDAAEDIGLRSLAVQVHIDKLIQDVELPCIAHWQQNHFVVIYKVTKSRIYISDPRLGKVSYTKKEFLENWEYENKEGVLLLLQPTPEFSNKNLELDDERNSISFILNYLKKYKAYIIQLFVGMLFGSILSLIFPFLSQSIVDYGIQHQDMEFIYLILTAQILLFIGKVAIEFIRSWILLHIGTRINISIVSDFLTKLMKLPMSFFDTRMMGDIIQRVHDHERIENFLTNSTLNVLFSLVNLVIFSFVLGFYNLSILLVFIIGTLFHSAWIFIFLGKRKSIDHMIFTEEASHQNNLIQLITGMHEIKLYGCERSKRWEWERIQARLFKINVKGLAIEQYQEAGALFINELKNILVVFLSAKLVIEGEITLGMMMAISYIIGQLNNPVMQLIQFVHSLQDAKISFDRLSEIHNKKNEVDANSVVGIYKNKTEGIYLNQVSFQYSGPNSEKILEKITMQAPKASVTAIVGASGSGKTTLLKLLLKYYPIIEGNISIGKINLNNINTREWRKNCGVVMQDGFLFSDSIQKNISIDDESTDIDRLYEAARIANIHDYIQELPLGYQTKIGADGHGLSQGQKQRILIARAVYRDPDYLFFDEATSALDAKNERIIIDNLSKFYKGKTVVIIAHRLSTVKNADQIVVLDQGKIVEQGNHISLTSQKSYYYDLVKNQLELGN